MQTTTATFTVRNTGDGNSIINVNGDLIVNGDHIGNATHHNCCYCSVGDKESHHYPTRIEDAEEDHGAARAMLYSPETQHRRMGQRHRTEDAEDEDQQSLTHAQPESSGQRDQGNIPRQTPSVSVPVSDQPSTVSDF